MEEFIFPGDIVRCRVCGQENVLFVKINEHREAFLDGIFCLHGKGGFERHKITRQQAARFIRKEKSEAADPEFIGKAERALLFLMDAKYQKKAA